MARRDVLLPNRKLDRRPSLADTGCCAHVVSARAAAGGEAGSKSGGTEVGRRDGADDGASGARGAGAAGGSYGESGCSGWAGVGSSEPPDGAAKGAPSRPGVRRYKSREGGNELERPLCASDRRYRGRWAGRRRPARRALARDGQASRSRESRAPRPEGWRPVAEKK